MCTLTRIMYKRHTANKTNLGNCATFSKRKRVCLNELQQRQFKSTYNTNCKELEFIHWPIRGYRVFRPFKNVSYFHDEPCKHDILSLIL